MDVYGYLHWKSRVRLMTLHHSLHCETLCYCQASVSTQYSHVSSCTASNFSNIHYASQIHILFEEHLNFMQHYSAVQRNSNLISYLSKSKWSAGGQHGRYTPHEKGFSRTHCPTNHLQSTRHFHQLVTHLNQKESVNLNMDTVLC